MVEKGHKSCNVGNAPESGVFRFCPRSSRPRRGYTLVEVSLVMALLVALAAFVIPSFYEHLRGDELPRSGRQLRSLISLVRAHAVFDGMRYRIRFPSEGEEHPLGDVRQPLIEREEDPVRYPEEYVVVTDPWARQRVLLGDVWCAEIRQGRPTIKALQDLRNRTGEGVRERLAEQDLEEDLEPVRLPLLIEPDGTSGWATFVLTTAPEETDPREVQDHPTVHVITEGETGLAWIQRPFYEEELDLFEEKNWPAVLRQDFLSSRVLTEDDVLELRESQLRGHDVRLEGRKMEVEP